ncbi:hypothetical protein CFI14_00980 [Lactiplantibacillus pentosus]|uniref:hypothetical protein n=1 Tax=Lactiplantibacillus pentosus TaxID=1589 RepID=UPI000EA91215|nr:hypothetical protein [Lactiplantibacillus pentosus]AYG37122.1 hypothetical protein CFK27_03840 [Lactiplantibacillus pentosus]AYG39778.1 hypothetical protein CFI14_00980 [Lactiplantibacillus pentosus]
MIKFKVKNGQLRPAGNSASLRKSAVVVASYTGLQAFLTTLERDGHRFKPTTHVLNTGLPRSMQYCRNVFGSDWDFRLATPERQAEDHRLTL